MNSGIRLKKITLNQSEKLIDFWKQSFNDAYHDVHTEKNIQLYCSIHFNAKQAKKFINDSKHENYFAVKNNSILGLLILKHHSSEINYPNASEIKHLYLLKSEYRSGLGSLLIKKAEDIISKKGSKCVWLCVSNWNKRAQQFYNKNNYEFLKQGPLLVVGTDTIPSSIFIKKFPYNIKYYKGIFIFSNL